MDNPPTAFGWGDGIKIGETKTNVFETSAFPYDTEFAIMIAAWDGYKWSAIDEVWQGTIDLPATTGDISTEAGSDEFTLSFPGDKVGWTLETSGNLTTRQSVLNTFGTLNSSWTTGLNGSGQSGTHTLLDKYIYEAPEKDIGFSTEVEFRPVFTFLNDFTNVLNDWTWPLSAPLYPAFEDLDRSHQWDSYINSTPNTDAAPPTDNMTLNGTPLLGVPLDIEIAYSETSSVGAAPWISLPYGKLLKLQSYKLRFIWKPYWPGWSFDFTALSIKVFRPNRKLIMSKAFSTSTTFIEFKDEADNSYMFFQQPTVQAISQTAGVIYNIDSYNQTGGLYDGVTLTAYDVTTGGTINASQCEIFVDGY